MNWIPLDEWRGVADFGNVPGWIEAVVTAVAVCVATVSLLLEVNRRRRAQARLVYASEVYSDRTPAGENLTFEQQWVVCGVGDYELDRGPTGHTILGVKEDMLRFDVVVHNRSEELIGPVQFQGPADSMPPSGWINVTIAIEPHDSVHVVFLRRPFNPAEMPPIDFTIAFRDSDGKWWKRDGIEPIHRISRRRARLIEDIGIR